MDKTDNDHFKLFGSKTIEELLYIDNSSNGNSTNPNYIFYKKYKSILAKHEIEFEYLITLTTELFCNFTPYLTSQRAEVFQKKFVLKTEDLTQAINKIVKQRTKLEKWEEKFHIPEMKDALNALDNLSKAYSNMKKTSQGGERKKLTYKRIAEEIKRFWRESLGHKKFLYDDGADDFDLAKEFTNDFLSMFFNIDNTRGLKEALREIADNRDA